MYGFVDGVCYLGAADASFADRGVALFSYGAHHHFDNANSRAISLATAKNGSGWHNCRYTVKAKQSLVGSPPTTHFRWQ